MIELKGVNKYFNKRKANEIHVIDNTSITLGDTGLVTFLGSSGCGKTTLLNTIGGLDKVNSGDIYIDGEKINCFSSSKKDDIRNLKIGYIFQNYNLIEDSTVFENVAIVLKMMGIRDRAEIEKRVMFVLERTGIDRYRNRPANTLSGGERQRVGIARAIVKNPSVIIADEPTGNLDSGNTIEIMNIIKAISRDKLVILVTHERNLAEFYADRIVEIVDGKVVNDRENSHENSLDYRIDNKIYLKDMPVSKELKSDNLKVEYYSDSDKPLDIKVIIKNGSIYVETDEEYATGSDNMEIVDDHYKELSKEEIDEYRFDYSKMEGKLKYRSIYTPFKSLKEGFKKIGGYSRIKKILLIGFVIASMFTLYAISNIAGVTNITDEKFMTKRKNYVTAATGKLSWAKYQKYVGVKNTDYALPGDSIISFNIGLDDYIQTAGVNVDFSGSAADCSLVSKNQVKLGRLPENDYEIAVDKMTANKLIEESGKPVGISKQSHLLGRSCKVPYLKDFKITGIVDTGSPCIYVKKDMLLPLALFAKPGEEPGKGEEKSSLVAENLMPDRDKVTITYGRMPEADNEVAIDESKREEIAIGRTLKQKVDGEPLKVVGFYHDRLGRDMNIVNQDTRIKAGIEEKKSVTICPSKGKKEQVIAELSDGSARIVDNYANDKEKYRKSIDREIKMAMVVAGIMILISFVEIFLMLRASFLSRIKEIGVLRAIGLKKRDIYRMFRGETIALTLMTAVPGMAFMTWILKTLVKVKFFADMYMINGKIVAIAFCIILIFNLIAGLLPVWNTLRKTPAQILARNDIN